MRSLKSVTALLSISSLSVALVLSGCASGSSRHAGAGGKTSGATTDAGYPGGGDGDEVVLYRWSTRHLVRYSTRKRAITFETRYRQMFQYGFSTRSDLYTSGDSLKYGFRLLDTGGDRTRTILDTPGAKGLFPVARRANQTIVSLVDYDGSGRIRRSRLARVAGGALEILAEVPASPLGGAILGDRVYFTAASSDGQKTYDLLAIDSDSKKPSHVRSGLKSPRIYAGNGELIVDGRVDGSNTSFPCDDECAVEDTGRWLFSLHPNQSNDLTLEVFSLESGRSVWSTTGDIVDFRLRAEDLTVYRNGDIIEHRLGAAS